MEFRLAKERDIAHLSTWFKTKEEAQNWGGPLIQFPILTEQLKKDISFDIHTSYSLLDKGELLGFIQLFDKYDFNHIGRVVINPSKRGEGFGEKLMLLLFAEYTQCDKIFSLYVYKDNNSAKKLYEKLGFVVCDDESNYAKEHNCFYMTKSKLE